MGVKVTSAENGDMPPIGDARADGDIRIDGVMPGVIRAAWTDGGQAQQSENEYFDGRNMPSKRISTRHHALECCNS
jgi:hypothetical protein